MVVVVPALSEGDECEDEAVLAVVVGLVAAGSKHMRQRIDAGCAVEEGSGANEETPHQQLASGHPQ